MRRKFPVVRLIAGACGVIALVLLALLFGFGAGGLLGGDHAGKHQQALLIAAGAAGQADSPAAPDVPTPEDSSPDVTTQPDTPTSVAASRDVEVTAEAAVLAAGEPSPAPSVEVPQVTSVDPAPTATAAPPSPTAAPPPPPPAPAAPVARSGYWDHDYEAAVLAGINAQRAAVSLPPLAPEPRLTNSAEGYAEQMLEAGDWYQHTGPDGRTFVQRIEDAGFPFTVPFGEVLAWASVPVGPDVIITAWMNSPTHREQILNPLYGLAGVGCYFAPNGGPIRCATDMAGD